MTKQVVAEYIWIDGNTPTALLRSKTKVFKTSKMSALELGDFPIWGFDGSSTNQAKGDASDVMLKPVAVFKDPVRPSVESYLVMCETFNPSGAWHWSNTRRDCDIVYQNFKDDEPLFGIEQEYTLLQNGRPLGFPDDRRFWPAPQGNYYCGVGNEMVYGREIAEEHLNACIYAGLKISGINAEVMPGQWEFQIGPLGPLEVSDQIWVARWLLNRIAEKHGVEVKLHPKPVPGDWNGAGAHTNFSTAKMREDYEACITACEALGQRHAEHIAHYGQDIDQRLTGKHETCSYKEFKYGVSDRGASIRIPWQVHKDQKGYIEDRRPNANCDPYVVTKMIVDTVCSAVRANRESVSSVKSTGL